MNRLKYKF